MNESDVAQIIPWLLDGELAELETLRAQWRTCHVEQCEYTGWGFYGSLVLPENAPRLPGNPSLVMGDVCADVEQLEHGCGFLLFIEKGLLKLLECHPWGDEGKPEEPSYSRLYYVGVDGGQITEVERRDMSSLSRKLSCC